MNEIKQTLRLKGDVLIETVLDSRGPKLGQIQLIFSRLTPDLSVPKYDINPENRDSLKPLGRYDPSAETLFYCVFVGHLNGPRKVAGSRHYQQITIDFRRYRLIVVWTTLGVPSTWMGRLRHTMSTAPRINKGQTGQKLIGPSSGTDAKGARDLALSEFSALTREVAEFANESGFEAIAVALNKVRFAFGIKNNLLQQVSRSNRRRGTIFPDH